QVSLGLDLRGGCYLLLEVDVAQVMRERLTNLLDGVRTAARTQRIAITNLAITGADAVTFKVRDAPDAEKARLAVKDLDPTAVTTTQPDGAVAMRFDPQQILDLNRKALSQSVEIVRRRID